MVAYALMIAESRTEEVFLVLPICLIKWRGFFSIKENSLVIAFRVVEKVSKIYFKEGFGEHIVEEC